MFCFVNNRFMYKITVFSVHIYCAYNYDFLLAQFTKMYYLCIEFKKREKSAAIAIKPKKLFNL